MKVTSLLLFFFNFFALIASAQLHWLNPKPSGFNNQKVFFINASTGYILNANGDLFVPMIPGLTGS